ncbi:bile salt-activated lipase-like [Chanos chanos]|uniref:Carboxylic ester hydrolase n=1 Tax=Chanos chanos TaxID=29144 RepID=A0A6J2WT50_CHACN|nr:bile salt-activated lipase-like [Chanos chanos]
MSLIGGILLAALCLGTASAASLGAVHTEGGMVEGKNVRMGFLRSVDVFKGIPFAAVPGRFEKPQPHPGWEGVLKAKKYKERCLQVTLLQTGTHGSEDCLYLNIFVPQGRQVSTDLPVMVYIYGGAFLLGASNDLSFMGNSVYDGREMADRGKVIVVTISYRVGTLGFLSTGDASLPGNYGLWDQHAAIAWVHRNIKAFGGNPDNITLFGQSAGSASVNYQMLSPYNKGLFRRAISQCGVAFSPWAMQRDPKALTKKIAEKVGCPTDEQMVTCLKMTDPVTLTTAGKVALSDMGNGPVLHMLEFAPVVDGDLIPDHPSKLFHHAAEIDYLAGTNSMDGHLFAGMDIPSINEKRKPTDPEEVRNLLAGLTLEKGEAAANLSYSIYSWDWGPNPDQEMIKKTVVDIETDYLFFVPTQIALHSHAKNSKGAKTYSYVFNMPTRIVFYPSWMEADHADDVQYVFGKPFQTPLAYFPRHRDVSGHMIAYWTNFARTGNPNEGESEVPTQWPAFTETGNPSLMINNKINSDSVKRNLRARYVSYWSTIYAGLPTI